MVGYALKIACGYKKVDSGGLAVFTELALAFQRTVGRIRLLFIDGV